MENQEQQEIIFKISMFEQQMKQIQQQVDSVEQGIFELNSLNDGLNELKNSKGKEILAPVGRGIFINSQITSEELLVDIGGKNLVKKNVSDTQKIILEQVNKLENAKNSLLDTMNQLNREVTSIIIDAQKKEENKQKSKN